ncbi:Regulatory sensor-transducer, BlaR1/MecR1 family [Desulfosporosinus sp. I2]|uniref:M56 family metallopeptidase n=1 Tax=Desulfosporosinus sp. I2 TaxID=1617025 RepID=UPI0005EDDFC1|nr:M56 family metallopeptidase [Desulfosporosinus sp. I2]KJR45418.1 Regulatory sensor-transducer, BlaR1/MecR1 family [Desulfosporosinus sp. I2]
MEIELVFNWVIKTSIMASILAVLILLVNYALRNKLDAKWQYAIWMLLIIRLLIPYDIQSPWSIYSLLPNNSVPIPMVNQANIRMTDNDTQIDISGKEIQLTNDQSIINKQSNTKAEGSIAKNLFNSWILAILWLVGVLVLASLTIAANLRFNSKVRREPFITDARMSNLMQECTSKLGIRKNLPIIITDRIDAPCLYGILSPKLLLPKPLVKRLNEENIRHIFIHELTHYKRNDILINWLAVAAQIVHWFNPLIWYSFAKMREDCELACDADTLSFLKPEEYQSYGLSIINLVTPAQVPWLPGTTGFFGNKNNHQIKRRIKMIKLFQKPTLKWTCTAVVIFISLGLVGFTNSISNATPAAGASTSKQTAQSNQLSIVTDGSFDYHKYLSFTPLLPTYTAGYQLTDSTAYKEITPPGNNVSRYLASYGNGDGFKFRIHETTSPEGMYPLYFADAAQAPKTQIQIGDVPATLYVSESVDYIQFIKNGIEYTAGSRHDGGISLDELKKICESIVVPVNSPPTNFFIDKTGPTASEGLSFKTLQPGDIVIPQGQKFEVASSSIDIEGDEKSEVFRLSYTAGASILNVEIGKGDHPFGEPTPVLTPDSDFDTKQIDGTEVKLRRKNDNQNLPAAKFTIPENSLECMLYTTVQESEVEKVVTSILQAYSKL